MKRLIALSVLLSACAGGTLHVIPSEPGHEQEFMNAGARLGVNIIVLPEDAPKKGAVEIEFKSAEWDEEKQTFICGRALERLLELDEVRQAIKGEDTLCTPKGWSCANVTFLTHELGHILGLPHYKRAKRKSDDKNLMRPAPTQDSRLNWKQRLVVQSSTATFERVCVDK